MVRESPLVSSKSGSCPRPPPPSVIYLSAESFWPKALVWVSGNVSVSDLEIQEHYDEFFEEVFTELEDKVCIVHVICAPNQQLPQDASLHRCQHTFSSPGPWEIISNDRLMDKIAKLSANYKFIALTF